MYSRGLRVLGHPARRVKQGKGIDSPAVSRENSIPSTVSRRGRAGDLEASEGAQESQVTHSGAEARQPGVGGNLRSTARAELPGALQDGLQQMQSFLHTR